VVEVVVAGATVVVVEVVVVGASVVVVGAACEVQATANSTRETRAAVSLRLMSGGPTEASCRNGTEANPGARDLYSQVSDSSLGKIEIHIREGGRMRSAPPVVVR